MLRSVRRSLYKPTLSVIRNISKSIVFQMFAKIVGCAFNAYNYWHSGMDELVYEAGLYCELEQIGFTIYRQEEFPIYYKGRPSPVKRRMDLVVKDRDLGSIILELKAINYVGEQQRKQLWSYLKLTNIRFGMLINFGQSGVYSENWELDENTGKCFRV